MKKGQAETIIKIVLVGIVLIIIFIITKNLIVKVLG
jgi:hypothetical protein